LKEDLSLNAKSNISQISIIDSRLVFNSESDFKIVQRELQNELNENDSNVFSFFNNLYGDGFISLYPLVEDEDPNGFLNSRISDINNNENLNTEALNNFDELEDAFGYETFSALLNANGEVQIDDRVFKYTDAGLFISPTDNYIELLTYLDERTISKDLLLSSSPVAVSDYISENNLCGGMQQISPTLSYFSLPQDDAFIIGEDICPTGGGSSNGTGNSSYTPPYQSTDDHGLASLSLNDCSGDRPILGNIFGSTWVCKDQYQSNRRVKTKYYDIDVYLAYAVGIKVKHQFQGWTGTWRKENITEMGLGVNSLTWKFTPQIYSQQGNFSNDKILIYSGGYGYTNLQDYINDFNGTPVALPNLPFNQGDLDVIIEIANSIPLAGLDNERDVTEFVYSNVFNQVRSQFRSAQNRELRKAGIVVYNGTETWVQYYDLERKCLNCDKLEKLLDWGAVTPNITYTIGTAMVPDPNSPNGQSWNDNWNFNLDFDFRYPEVTELKGYGMARSGTNQWHGNRVNFD
jgi:hypothetical protein